jgi:transketolase
MRKTCFSSLYDLAAQDNRVVFIGSDITKQGLTRFVDDFPDRFFLEGIYEGHIIGMASGMALCGKIPYINTIATFATRRCFEQIVVDCAMQNLPLRIIGSGGGTVYAPLGSTHLAFDDIAILRAIPNMSIVAPCDAEEMKKLMAETLDYPGPLYIRLAKGGDKVITQPDTRLLIGKAVKYRDGDEVALVTSGITTALALEAAQILETNSSIKCSVVHYHTLKPFDKYTLLKQVGNAGIVITVEEHSINGGLGSIAAEIIAEAAFDVPKKFARIGYPDVFPDHFGSQNKIMERYGISVYGIVNMVMDMV